MLSGLEDGSRGHKQTGMLHKPAVLTAATQRWPETL